MRIIALRWGTDGRRNHARSALAGQEHASPNAFNESGEPSHEERPLPPLAVLPKYNKISNNFSNSPIRLTLVKGHASLYSRACAS